VRRKPSTRLRSIWKCRRWHRSPVPPHHPRFRTFALDTCIADVLEDNVDERFFLKPDSVIKFLTVNEATDGSDIHYMVTDHKLSDEEIREARKE